MMLNTTKIMLEFLDNVLIHADMMHLAFNMVLALFFREVSLNSIAV